MQKKQSMWIDRVKKTEKYIFCPLECKNPKHVKKDITDFTC